MCFYLFLFFYRFHQCTEENVYMNLVAGFLSSFSARYVYLGKHLLPNTLLVSKFPPRQYSTLATWSVS